MVREKHQNHCYHDAVACGLIQTKLCGLGDLIWQNREFSTITKRRFNLYSTLDLLAQNLPCSASPVAIFYLAEGFKSGVV